MLGVIDDVEARTPIGFAAEGDAVLLLGETRDELDGSAWAQVAHGHLGGRPPRFDLAAERALAEILVAGSRDGMIASAHDLSDGGLAQALVESALRGGRGARIVLPEGVDAFTALFSESGARAIVTVPRSEELRFTEMCAARGFACVRAGVVLGEESEGASLEVQGQFTLPLAEVRAAWSATLPAVLDAVG